MLFNIARCTIIAVSALTFGSNIAIADVTFVCGPRTTITVKFDRPEVNVKDDLAKQNPCIESWYEQNAETNAQLGPSVAHPEEFTKNRALQRVGSDAISVWKPLPGHCAENGSCFGDISQRTGRPKTVRVKGHYRNGKWVKEYYRSKPERK